MLVLVVLLYKSDLFGAGNNKHPTRCTPEALLPKGKFIARRKDRLQPGKEAHHKCKSCCRRSNVLLGTRKPVALLRKEYYCAYRMNAPQWG